MPIDKAVWMHRFSERLLEVREVLHQTSLDIAEEQYAFESDLDPEESARVYCLDMNPSANVGDPE
jgi:hypothetical protein